MTEEANERIPGVLNPNVYVCDPDGLAQKFRALAPRLHFHKGKLCKTSVECEPCLGPISVFVDGDRAWSGFTEASTTNNSRSFSFPLFSSSCQFGDCPAGTVETLQIQGVCDETPAGLERWEIDAFLYCRGIGGPNIVPEASTQFDPDMDGTHIFEKECLECSPICELELWTQGTAFPLTDPELLCTLEVQICSLFEDTCLVNQTDLEERP